MTSRPPASRPTLFSGSWEVPADLAGAPVDRVLRTLLGNVSWNAARKAIDTGKVYLNGERVLIGTTKVSQGQTLELRAHTPRASSTGRLGPGALVHVDSQVVVVEKPAGIATVPFEDSERNTLDVLVANLLARGDRPRPLHVVHRLDKETSGLLVFARSLEALRTLKSQFRFHSVKRRYLALVHGSAASGTIRSRLVTDRGDGRRGSTDNPRLGREAITHVQRLEALGTATLVACRLETGRTHQIRIHLAEQGHPLLGERVYSKGYTGDLLPAPRVMLHAAELGFVHPSTQRPLLFESDLPADFESVLQRLRNSSSS
jgi:23S rRNA pseudouridine1911/1915/1917 synthase